MHPAIASSYPDQQHLVAISRAPTRTNQAKPNKKTIEGTIEQTLGWVDIHLLVIVLGLLLLLATATAA